MMLGSNSRRTLFQRQRPVPGDYAADPYTPSPLDELRNAQLPDTGPSEFQRGADLGGMAAGVPNLQKKPSIFDRIGSVLANPEVSGMLLRNGYSMLTGGNPMAGFAWQEQRRGEAENQRRWQLGYGLQQREADRGDFSADAQARHYENSDYTDAQRATTERQVGLGQVRNSANRNVIEDRGNYRDNATRYGIAKIDSATSSANSERSAAASRYGSDRDYEGRVYATDGSVYSDLHRPAAGIGTNSYKITTKTPASPGASHWFAPDEPATPETRTEQQFPVPPATAIQAARKNPQLRDDFEQMFGPGSWGRFVGQ